MEVIRMNNKDVIRGFIYGFAAATLVSFCIRFVKAVASYNPFPSEEELAEQLQKVGRDAIREVDAQVRAELACLHQCFDEV